ncbi:SDR family oxidoreductase [Rhizohabitans arisaemae]|uniref:SDR family oxidoreductase n=1 Tax=Rhizohabitans arisaemae TaxID=2720610 RepID=UPI0024B11FE4|nr:SDR family oxidoreductase [Rhizohabitans arisaemae]
MNGPRQPYGRLAIVTGGVKGIGAAIVARLADSGFAVAVLDRDPAGEDLPCARAYRVDVADHDRVAEAVHAATAEFGPPAVVVNNAGWDRVQPFVENEPELWQTLIGVNLVGVLNVTHAALPSMREAGGGRFVNVASDAGRVGSSGEAVYSACKGGVIAFTKAIAREGARHGVLANCVCPGPTATPLLESMRSDPATDKIMEAMVRATPLRKLATPQDVAAAVGFFAEEPGHVTGQVLSVSGGLTMSG